MAFFGRVLAWVTLAGAPATITSSSGTTITATVLTVSFPAGDYLLTVSTGNGQSQNDEYDLTIGAVGPQGPEGDKGDIGDQGPQGPEGDKGDTGDQGPQGPIGMMGLPGNDGADGADGADGEQGPPGPVVAIGTSCPAGQAVVGMDGSGNFICATFGPRISGATCVELEFSGTIWGMAVKGLDLRARTNSTLHFIGAIPAEGGSFFCQDNPVLETLNFGTSGTLRALVDPGNANGNNMSGGPFTCCSATNPDSVCNAPDKPADATALCKALGYASGSVIISPINSCPEAEDFSGANDGSDWSSDFVGSGGGGREFTCTGFLP